MVYAGVSKKWGNSAEKMAVGEQSPNNMRSSPERSAWSYGAVAGFPAILIAGTAIRPTPAPASSNAG
jgi:hypothetical protein